MTALLGAMLAAFAPVDPEAPEATQWLVDELAKPEYAAAQPTLVDLVGQAIAEWLSGLLTGASGAPPVLAIVIGLLVVAAIVTLGIVFGGRVRRNRRTTAVGDLFGADEQRSARELRSAAEAAMRRGDWAGATTDAYRAIARDAAERELVTVTPGLTAHGFAARAGSAFPADGTALERAARAFDVVRYLGGAGSEADAREVLELGDRLASSRAGRADRAERVGA